MSVSNTAPPMKDVTDGTVRQVLDDLFEESRLRRSPLERDLSPDELARMELPTDPFVGFYRGTIRVGQDEFEEGNTLVVASSGQRRRYLLKRWDGGRHFKAYQSTPTDGEKLRLGNVYRVMLGRAVDSRV